MNVVYVAVPTQLPNECEPQVLLACRSCLDTENSLYDLHQIQSAQIFGEFTGIPVFPTDGYPQYICSLCLHQIKKFYSFRVRCHSAMYLLQQARLCNAEITTDIIKAIDRTHVKLNLVSTEPQYLDLTVKTHEDKETNTSADELNYVEGSDEQVEEETQTDGDVLGYDENENNEVECVNESSVPEKEVEIVKPKRVRRGFRFRKVRKLNKKYKDESEDLNISDAEGDEVTIEDAERWKTIMREIDEENARSVVIRRRKMVMDDIKFMIKRANKFSEIYNVDVKFLTVEEQQREREERRSADSFQTAAYKCDECVKVFPTEATYDRHKPNHSPEMGDYSCDVCKYRFYTLLMYRKHFSSCHTKQFICRECGMVTRFWSEAREHAKFHDGNKISCEHCPMTFTGKKLLMAHVRTKHNSGVTLCSLCGGLFVGPVGLKIHTDKVHKNTIKCPYYCLRSFLNEEALQKHLELTNKGECVAAKSYCSTCGQSFQSETEFRDHFNEFHKTDLKCHQCYIYFTDPVEYSKHMENHLTNAFEIRTKKKQNFKEKQRLEKIKKNEEKIKKKAEKRKKPQKCDLCAKNETCIHKTKVRIREQKCMLCGKMFFKQSTLKNHLVTHQAERKKFICEVCGKEKPSLAHLKYHQRVHSGEKPYQCGYCYKSYTLKHTLICHISTHTGDRPYKCTICNKGFTQPPHLTAHMLTHSQERPYACSTCDKRYRCASALREHNDTAHRGLPHRTRSTRSKAKGAGG